MNIKALKELIADLPDEMLVSLEDPNFGGPLNSLSFYMHIKDNCLLINFPFMDAVD